MRAIVVSPNGEPLVDDIPEPEGEGEVVRVQACGLCGSDVEKLTPEHAGTVLGHEVVAETADGRLVTLVHHRPCDECERCRSGHESTCESFRAATIVPGGFAERAAATGGYVDLPRGLEPVIGTFAEPLACVLRGAERLPNGDVLVLGGGFIGRLFAWVLRRRGDRVSIDDIDPARRMGRPPRRAEAVVMTAPGMAAAALERVSPGGTLLLFTEGGRADLGPIYRSEATVVGSRSATPRHLAEAVELLPELDLPEPLVLPLDRFVEGVALYRRRGAFKVVFTP